MTKMAGRIGVPAGKGMVGKCNWVNGGKGRVLLADAEEARCRPVQPVMASLFIACIQSSASSPASYALGAQQEPSMASSTDRTKPALLQSLSLWPVCHLEGLAFDVWHLFSLHLWSWEGIHCEYWPDVNNHAACLQRMKARMRSP